MSRSGYSDCLDDRALNLWRGTVERAIKGRRGQALLRAMLEALDAMPVKRLVPSVLVSEEGECCAMGAVALAKGISVDGVDETDREQVAALFDIAPALAAEIAYENDEECRSRYERDASGRLALVEETPEQRWVRMRAWVVEQIKAQP